MLGAGGVLGASWLIGTLEAVEAQTGWRAGEAERIVGTSAGSVIGALTAAGIRPAEMVAYAAGDALDRFAEAEARAESAAERVTGGEYRVQLSMPSFGPGSWRLVASTLIHPRRHGATAVLAGWLPRGFISTAPISDLVDAFIPGDWPDHPSFWAVAADYGNGRRVAFGAAGAPPATVADAVAASCAIPGFYHPVRIGDRRYVDGGICSVSNLDLLRGLGLELVICLNPMSSAVQATGGSAADGVGAVLRAAASRRLSEEVRKLREGGTDVLLLEPCAEDLALMGTNLMNPRRRLEVMQQARESVARDLRSRSRPLPGAADRRGGVEHPRAA